MCTFSSEYHHEIGCSLYSRMFILFGFILEAVSENIAIIKIS
jgi:hypothetical protein